MKRLLLFGLLAFSLASCAPLNTIKLTKQLPPFEENVEVMVYDMGDTVPENVEVLGGILLSNKDVLNYAKNIARVVGGNGLEVQMYSYPYEENTYQTISAFILNINDSISPTASSSVEKMDFYDFIVTKEHDTIPCFVFSESKNAIGLVWGKNNQGFRKTIFASKNNLLSYHVEDPKALDEMNYFRKKTFLHKKLFTTQLAIDGGVSFPNDEPDPMIAGKIRFQSNHKFTFGANYNYYHDSEDYFIAGCIGLFGVPLSRARGYLDYYLDGGCGEKKTLERNRFYLDFLFGYYCTVIGKWSTGWGEHGNLIEPGIGIGLACAYDYLITKHFGIGIEMTGVEGVSFNKEWITKRISFSAGLRYYL